MLQGNRVKTQKNHRAKPGRGSLADMCHNRQPFQLYVQPIVVLVPCCPQNPSKSPELVNDQIHTRLHWLQQCVVAG